MRSSKWWVRAVMLARAVSIDLNNFHLLHYRRVGGFLVTGKNSGTHWLKWLLSHAIAAQHHLPPPAQSSGRESEDFIGHPRWPRKYPQAPRIGASHNLPSSILNWRGVRDLVRLPPIIVLVRDPMEAMLSVFVKWGGLHGLTLPQYVRLPVSLKSKLPADAWWYVEFFNKWGWIARTDPSRVLVLRYEDLSRDPAACLRRIAAHYRFELSEEAIAAALSVADRETVRARQDPNHGETVVPALEARNSVAFSADDRRFLRDLFAEHMTYDFGYGYAKPRTGAALAPFGVRAPGGALRALTAPRAVAGWGLGATAALALLVVVSPLRPATPPTPTVYATAKGEHRTVRLADGTVADLSGGSRILVSLTKGHRDVTMTEGEVAFQVVHDPNQPFTLRVGDRMLRDIGTEFDVRRGAGEVAVTVREGRVDVGPGADPTAPMIPVVAGRQLRHRDGADQSTVAEVAADNVFAWKRGLLIYQDQPLRVVLDDLNRYFPQPLRLADPKLADLRFTGALTVDGEKPTVQRLAALMSLSAAETGDAITLGPNPASR
ncbi:MAG: FecR domain-containing protein [Caulobacteraceae bacterium]|nr:FecR domain-containing protein [Caulobacteraceae bacterium]